MVNIFKKRQNASSKKKKKKNKTVGLNRQVLKLSLVNKYENTQPV